MDKSLTGLVALNLTESVTYDAYRSILERFKTVDEALAAPEQQLAGIPGIGPKTARKLKQIKQEEITEEIEQAKAINVEIITCNDESYPHNLRFIEDRPLVLYVRGEITETDTQAISIIGSRRASIYGEEQARRFSRDLSSVGFTIVSGLAYGIDKVAHEMALECGGRTIAVLGSGFLKLYPARHEKLAHKISGQGAVISEFPLESEPNPWNFPRRNRIISGLSLGTLVVEAAIKSGALLTAGIAAKQGKEVFALPARVTDRQSEGALKLIRDGAKLVTCPADIVDEYPQLSAALVKSCPASMEQSRLPELSETESVIWGILGAEPKHIDSIIEESGLAVSQVLSTLLVLEVKKAARQYPGKLFTRMQ